MKLDDLKPLERLPLTVTPCPIQEAVIELRFEPNKSPQWDAVPGIVMNTLEDLGWGNLERLPIADVPREIVAMEANLQHSPHFSLNKEQYLLLLGPKMFALCNKPPYDGWSAFFGEFLKVYHNIQARLVKQMSRIGLRYIDEFRDHVLPNTKLDLAVGGETLAMSRLSLHLPIEGRDGFQLNLRVASGLPLESDPSQSKSVIDLDASLNPVRGDILGLIESAHKQQKELFFTLLKDEFLDSLNPTY